MAVGVGLRRLFVGRAVGIRCALGVLAAVALVAGWAAGPAVGAERELVVAFQGGAVTLDPHARQETTTLSWQRHIFDTVTLYRRDGSIAPAIATAWESVSPTKWRLKVRQGVRFHDGSLLKPEDVAYSIWRAKTHPKSQMKGYLTTVSSVSVAGSGDVEIETAAPDPLMPLHLAFIMVVPKAYVEANGDQVFNQRPIGTGPYRFVEWLTEDHLTLEANPDYWAGPPPIKRVKLVNVPNPATRVASLLSGEIQVAEKVPPQDFARVERSGRAYLTQVPGIRVIYLVMDYFREKDSPGMAPGQKNPFMDPRVRRAVYQAIDADLIVRRVMGGAATPATQFVAPSVEGYNPNVRRFPYDPEAARRLLAEAGYPNGFTVRLDAPNDRYLNDALIAQAVGGMLSRVGITTEVNAVPKAVFFPQVDKGDFTIYLAGWGSVDIIETLNSQVHTRDPVRGYGVVNRARYSNPQVDRLIEEAATQFDRDRRLQLIYEAVRIAQERDVFWVPLHYENVIAGVSNDVMWESRPDEYIFAFEMNWKR